MSFALDVAHVTRPRHGAERSGDLCVTHQTGAALRAVVIDGIGHGDEAADAAQAIARAIDALPANVALTELFGVAHAAARGTRGAVMSAVVANGDLGELAWAGVGNVEGVVHKGDRRERLMVLGGIVGERLPTVQARRLPFAVGDVLVLCTDGAAGAAFDNSAGAFGAVAAANGLAEQLLARHGKRDDDALVFVARPRAESGQP